MGLLLSTPSRPHSFLLRCLLSFCLLDFDFDLFLSLSSSLELEESEEELKEPDSDEYLVDLCDEIKQARAKRAKTSGI